MYYEAMQLFLNLLDLQLVSGINVLDFLLISLIMIAGASLQASAGFGSGLVAIPLLGLVDVRMVPGPILFAYLFLCFFMYWNERKHVSLNTQKYLIWGLLLGSCIGFITLFFIDKSRFPLIAASMVLLGVAFSLFQKKIELKAQNLLFAGSCSGLMSTLAGLSGPPMALLLQFQNPAFIRANLAFAFIFASLFSISALLLKQLFNINDILLGFLLVPGMFIGFYSGKYLARFMDAKKSRYTILILASASAISLFLKSI